MGLVDDHLGHCDAWASMDIARNRKSAWRQRCPDHQVRAPSPDWSRVYSPQREIWAYIRRCADQFGVTDHVRLGHEVLRADWDDARARWLIETAAGPVESQFLISAMGPLSDRSLPDIAGLETFEGRLLPLGGLGSRLRSRRQPGGRDRDRRVGGPVDPRDPAGGRPAARVPAHAALDLPENQPPHHPDRARALPALSRAPADGANAPVLVPREHCRVPAACAPTRRPRTTTICGDG